jgi:hypothetical protein
VRSGSQDVDAAFASMGWLGSRLNSPDAWIEVSSPTRRLRALEHVASYAKCIGHSIDVIEPRGNESDLKDPAVVEPHLSQPIVIRA